MLLFTGQRVHLWLLLSKTTWIEFKKVNVAEGIAGNDVSTVWGDGNANEIRHTL